MKKRLKYLFVFIACLVICVLIVILFKDFPFIRGFIGDVIVILLVFSFMKIFLEIDALKLCVGVLIFSFSVELLQLTNFIEMIGLEDVKIAKIIFGATFDFWDLLAYLVGTIFTYFLNKHLIEKAY